MATDYQGKAFGEAHSTAQRLQVEPGHQDKPNGPGDSGGPPAAPDGGTTDWRDEARRTRLPVFPIRIIAPDPLTGKRSKRPLTARGHLDASFDPDHFGGLWSAANGYGIKMGRVATRVGYYAFDIDPRALGADGGAVALAWLGDHAVPLDTRRHGTPSGGEHLIYALPGSHDDLPNRQGIVPGLDARGEGGWIAFGEGYSVLADVAPVLLPTAVCATIRAGWKGGTGATGAAVELPDLAAVDAEAVYRKLLAKIGGRGNFGLFCLWRDGVRRHQGDTTRSAADHSAAFYLALAAFSAPEIAHLLLTRFKHGVAARDGVTPVTIRAAQRSAAKAASYVQAERAALRPELVRSTPEAADAYLATLETSR
jgi:hypothetical protein